jgi:hypothetical protein
VAGPVQGPGFDRVTGSVLFLKKKKLKRRRFSKKKGQNSTGLQPGHLVNPQGKPGHTGFFLSLFFL